MESRQLPIYLLTNRRNNFLYLPHPGSIRSLPNIPRSNLEQIITELNIPTSEDITYRDSDYRFLIETYLTTIHDSVPYNNEPLSQIEQRIRDQQLRNYTDARPFDEDLPITPIYLLTTQIPSNTSVFISSGILLNRPIILTINSLTREQIREIARVIDLNVPVQSATTNDIYDYLYQNNHRIPYNGESVEGVLQLIRQHEMSIWREQSTSLIYILLSSNSLNNRLLLFPGASSSVLPGEYVIIPMSEFTNDELTDDQFRRIGAVIRSDITSQGIDILTHYIQSIDAEIMYDGNSIEELLHLIDEHENGEHRVEFRNQRRRIDEYETQNQENDDEETSDDETLEVMELPRQNISSSENDEIPVSRNRNNIFGTVGQNTIRVLPGTGKIINLIKFN
jgi:hypothetical protein